MMDWHNRFVQQSAWTSALRQYLFEHTGMQSAGRVLEVGCGTGAILSDLVTRAIVHGLDLDATRLAQARLHAPQANLACADALWLPYAPGVFDITFCHFLLMWVRDPLQALGEMKRVTRLGGSILALAEPDYTARVDKPDELAQLGRWQTESLRSQGADPGVGSRLELLFRQAGLQPIETGLLQQQGGPAPAPGERDLEWAVLEADLGRRIPTQEMQRLKRLDETAWERGERVLYVPTYWVFGTRT